MISRNLFSCATVPRFLVSPSLIGCNRCCRSASDKRRLRDLMQQRLQDRQVGELNKPSQDTFGELPLSVSVSLGHQRNVTAEAGQQKTEPYFPFKRYEEVNYSGDPLETSRIAGSSALDRGFHIRADGTYMDDYVAGTIRDLPLDKEYIINICPGVTSSLYCTRDGSADSVEDIFFQQPHQVAGSPKTVKVIRELSTEKNSLYGTENAELAPSKRRCQGCGAAFHCMDMSLPGFVSYELFINLNTAINPLCRRCYLVKKHNFLVNVNVTPVDYKRIIGHLKLLEEVLILMMVDLMDFPCSLMTSLPDLIGRNKSVIVLANKADLLPLTSENVDIELANKYIYAYLREHGFCDNLNVVHTRVISAKTGWGVESLITFIHKFWANRGDIYLLGCTNSGKSTLFNTLLQSDLCKVRAVDLVERATTSPWPGTTLNLLKFPVLNPTAKRLVVREARLRKFKRRVCDMERLKRLAITKRQRFSLLNGYLDMSFKQNIEMDPTDAKNTAAIQWDPEYHDFKCGHWFYDTPGVVNDNQILNLLTLEELVQVIPKEMIVPRQYLLNPHSTLLIAGLARLEKSEGTVPTMVKVYASSKLPVFVLPSADLPQFTSRHFGTGVLKVPTGSSERLQQFPDLQCKELSLNDEKLLHDSLRVDIVLSVIGWVSVKRSSSHLENRYRAWTPMAKGIHVRPSFVC